MISSAVLSADKLYRYRLKRAWADGDLLPIVMLNPSTADAQLNDPTIRRCIKFAAREGMDGVAVANLYGLRATDPEALRTAVDPFGPDNDDALNDLLLDTFGSKSSFILCAWGVLGGVRGGDARFVHMAKSRGVALRCLGKTKAGHPRHPLYLAGDTPLESFP